MLEIALDRLTRFIEGVLALAFIFAVCLNFVNVVGRYVIGSVILSADEIEVYIMVIMTFLGASVVSWRREQIRMDILANALSKRVQTVISVLELLLLATIAAFVAWQSCVYAIFMFQIGRVSDAAGIPMWTIHALVFAGFCLIGLIAISRGLRKVWHLRGSTQVSSHTKWTETP